MTLTDSNLRYLLAIHRLAKQNTDVSPLALAQAMGVTKPSVTSILTSLMKQGVIVRRRYGKIYITAMTLTDSNLRYLLAIHRLAKQNTDVSPLALAQAMGVTKPSVTSILTSLMKQGVIVRRRYGKIYITDRGVLYARYYDDLVETILQHFPLADMGFTPDECRNAAIAMAVALPAKEIDEKCKTLYDNENS